jgi:hypothetical protein
MAKRSAKFRYLNHFHTFSHTNGTERVQKVITTTSATASAGGVRVVAGKNGRISENVFNICCGIHLHENNKCTSCSQ